MNSKNFTYTKADAKKGTNLKLPSIDVWKNQYKRNYTVKIILPEFTSVCPKTGLPDFGTVIIEYTPDKYCLELKSLKHYLLSYRNMGIFMENSINKILGDVVKYAKPKKAVVTGEFTPRGGLVTTVTANYGRK